MSPLKIIIVGAGIGGPAAAIGLARNGHDVTIYERVTNTGDIGYAFRITPNSDHCLKYLGVDAEAGGAVVAKTVRMITAEGKVIGDMRDEKTEQGTSVFAYRPQLNQQLMDAASESGVVLKSGIKVKAVDTTRTAIVLENDEAVQADLIIGADGVHSAIRPHIVDSTNFFPKPSTGHNAFRFLLSKSTMQNDPITSPMIDDDVQMFAWFAPDKQFLVYPVDYGKLFNFTCTHPEALSDKHTIEDDSVTAVAYNQRASVEMVVDIYRDFDPIAIRMLQMADPDGFRVWKLMDMDEIPHWSLGHTVLLGDACHPVSPFSISGASMAIEDAVTLSELLTPDLLASDIQERLKLYEQIRRPRVGRVRQEGRNRAKGPGRKEELAEYKKFLSSHDAVKVAKDALRSFLEAKSEPT